MSKTFSSFGLSGFIFLSTIVANANVVGSDFQNFNPTYNSLDFITLHSSETLQPCILNTGLFFNQAYNSLPFYESVDFNINEFRNRSTYSDTVGGFDFSLGYGLTENLDLGLNIQSIVSQSVESDSLVSGSFSDKGLTEVRFNSKYRFFGDSESGAAVVASVNVNTIENNVFLGDGAGPTVNVEGVYDRHFKRVNWAVNLGYRLRQPGDQIEVGVPPMGDAVVYSTGISYHLSNMDTKLVWELFGSYPVDEVEGVSRSQRSNLETLLGIKHDVNNDWAALGGFGSEVASGTSTPDWRFFVGLNWALECCDNDPAPKLEPVRPPLVLDVKPLAITELEPDLPAAEPDEVFIFEDVNFKTASHTRVYGKSLDYLSQLGDYLSRKGFKRLIVVGHTDSVGTDEYNMDLSKRRATAIANHLINTAGFDRDRVRIRYYGESQPIDDNGNFQGRKRNRRVEFHVYY